MNPPSITLLTQLRLPTALLATPPCDEVPGNITAAACWLRDAWDGGCQYSEGRLRFTLSSPTLQHHLAGLLAAVKVELLLSQSLLLHSKHASGRRQWQTSHPLPPVCAAGKAQQQAGHLRSSVGRQEHICSQNASTTLSQLATPCLAPVGAGVGGRVPTWRMVPGSSTESLALDVALQCGVPLPVVQRAAELWKVGGSACLGEVVCSACRCGTPQVLSVFLQWAAQLWKVGLACTLLERSSAWYKYDKGFSLPHPGCPPRGAAASQASMASVVGQWYYHQSACQVCSISGRPACCRLAFRCPQAGRLPALEASKPHSGSFSRLRRQARSVRILHLADCYTAKCRTAVSKDGCCMLLTCMQQHTSIDSAPLIMPSTPYHEEALRVRSDSVDYRLPVQAPDRTDPPSPPQIPQLQIDDAAGVLRCVAETMLAAESAVDQTEPNSDQPGQQLEHAAGASAGSRAAAVSLNSSQGLSTSSLNGSLASAASAETASTGLLSAEHSVADSSQGNGAHIRLHYQIVRAGQVPPPSTVGCSCIYVLRRSDGRFYCGQTDNMKGGLCSETMSRCVRRFFVMRIRMVHTSSVHH